MLSVFKNKNLYLSSIILFLMLVFALNAPRYSKLTLDGITVWAFSVLPSVFVFFILSSLLSSLSLISTLSQKLSPLSKRLFNVSGLSFYSLFMSVLSGYPTGAKITVELLKSGAISKQEAITSSILSSTSSLSFFLGTIGGMIGSFSAFIMLICHYLSVFITTFLFKSKTAVKTQKHFAINKVDNIIYNSIYGSVVSVLVLGGIITFYYVLIEMAFDLKILAPFDKLFTIIFGDGALSKAFLTGIFESIKGIKLISLCSSPLVLPLIGFVITFGGFSVITQTAIYLKEAKIKIAPFVLIKLLQAIICFILLYLICLTPIL